MRADRGAAGNGVARPSNGERFGELRLGVECRHFVEPILDSADELETRPRKRFFGLGAGAVEPLDSARAAPLQPPRPAQP